MKLKTPWWIWLLSFLTLGLWFCFWIIHKKDKEAKIYVNDLINNSKTYSVNDFFQMYEAIKKSNLKIKNVDESGIYIIHNISSDKYYVGQSVNVIKRVNNHLTGKGNGDVYADLKYGAKMTINIVKCEKEELDFVEKQCIEKYNAFKLGYNKNRGIGRGYL